MSEKLLLTPEEAAELLSLSRSTLYRLMARGEMPSHKVGRARRVPRALLEQFVARLQDSSDLSTVQPSIGVSHGRPGREAPPSASQTRLPLDRRGTAQGRARRQRVAREPRDARLLRATAAQVVDAAEASEGAAK
jgi:excisionase family DNA binding protein